MGTELENKEISEISLRVGHMRLWDLHDYMVTELKQFLKNTSKDGEEIPNDIIGQFRMLLENRDDRRWSRAFLVGRFINYYEHTNWEANGRNETISSLKAKVEHVFRRGDWIAQANLRGEIEIANLETLALPNGEGFIHPCFSAEEALKEKNRKDKERKKKAAMRKTTKKGKADK